jgi:hypothetical protein
MSFRVDPLSNPQNQSEDNRNAAILAEIHRNDLGPAFSDFSSLPPEYLAKLLANLKGPFNPESSALRSVSHKLNNVARSHLASMLYFESKDTHTFQEIKKLIALHPHFTHQMPFTLDLSDSNITDDELKSIIKKFPNIIEINATRCHALTDAGLADLARLSNLTNLNLKLCRQITDAGLAHLARLSTLTSLSLTGCDQITNAGLAYLARLSNLTSLSLAACDQIRDAGLDHLARLSNLTNLNLTDCYLIRDAGLANLATLSNLTILNLTGCNQITDAGLADIATLSNLTSLNLTECNQITDAGLADLKAALAKLIILR